jgi:hypothetical protein
MNLSEILGEATTGYDKHGYLVNVDGPLTKRTTPGGDTTYWVKGEPVGSILKGAAHYWYSMPDVGANKEERFINKKMPGMISRKPNEVTPEVFDQMLKLELQNL